MKNNLALTAIFTGLCLWGSAANSKGVDSAALYAAFNSRDSMLNSLDYKTGKIPIGDNLATITVPEGFAFLNAKDAQFILSDLWGNPKSSDILGILVPGDVSMLDANGWAIVYSYDPSGHVMDDDAGKTNYDDLLEEMKKQFVAANPERIKSDYKPIELIGWAKKPFYDKSSHKLHWAKEIKFDKDSANTLNYNIRMLGRKGVLVMNIVSGMGNISTVESNMDKVISSTDFNSGNRYDDFNTDVDKVAEYGIGGLVAGGILLKTGILAKIGLMLLKTWKLIALGVASFFGLLRKKLFGKKTDKADTGDSQTPAS